MAQSAESENIPFSFETNHTDSIHDVQMDYYGRYLATASSDHSVKLYEISNNSQRHLLDLKGHDGPVWRVSWAHPRYGKVLGSCGYDRQIIIWRENKQKGNWEKWFIDNNYNSSVNCISFAPNDLSSSLFTFITGDGDGIIRIYNYKQKWELVSKIEEAHLGGVTSISWSLPINIVKLIKKDSNSQPSSNNGIIQRFVSGGCDNIVKIFQYNPDKKNFQCQKQLKGHTDWIRDVGWAPIPGSETFSIVASCGEDKTVRIWREKNGKWIDKSLVIKKYANKVWSLAWSELGNILAVAHGENNIEMFKEALDGSWKNVSEVNDQ